MESLAALGLAANVIQFIQFGARLTSETSELYRSVDGATEGNAGIEWATEQVKELSAKLDAPLVGSVNYENEHRLREMSKECTKVAETLLSLLDDLKVKGLRKRWEPFKQAIRSMTYEKRIESLRKRLNDLHGGLVLCLLKIMRDEQSPVRESLDKILQQHDLMQIDGTTKLQELRKDLVTGLEDARQDLHSQNKQTLAKSKTAIEALIVGNKEAGAVQSVLRSLRYDQMEARLGAIDEAHKRTFEWIFRTPDDVDSEKTSFVSWLCNGEGIFWIAGRAGSGKSTLMKYLWRHRNVIQSLQDWAGPKRLVIGSHFFWYAGTKMQKSQEGLLCSLLDNILTQCPELISTVAPLRWRRAQNPPYHDEAWTRSELFGAFDRLQKQILLPVKFCFFVDGLDEYDGDHAEIVELLQIFMKTSDVKVCASSRPWNVFENSLGDGHAQLKLEDLTRDDIHLYVHEKLGLDPRFINLEEGNGKDSKSRLIETVVNTAHGVFLWVILVVRDLLRGLSNDDTTEVLEKRLHSIPPTLEGYFGSIMNRVDAVYREETSKILMMAETSMIPLPLMWLSFLDRKDIRYAIDLPIRSLQASELASICKKTRIRVKARVSDLMVVDPGKPHFVTFLHRTVRDWLVTPDIQDLLHRQLCSPFDPIQYFCNAILAQMKMGCSMPNQEHGTNAVAQYCNNAIFIHCLIIYAMSSEELAGSVLYLDILDEAEIAHQHHHCSTYKGVYIFLNAIKAGLCAYVEKRMTQNPALARGHSDYSCLEFALFYTQIALIHSRYSLRVAARGKLVDLKMLRLLLSHGASPNQYLKSNRVETIFTKFLEMRPRNSEANVENSKRVWFEAVKLMVTAGANSNVQSRDEAREAGSMLENYLSDEELRCLRQTMRTTKRDSGLLYQFRNWLGVYCGSGKENASCALSEDIPLLEPPTVRWVRAVGHTTSSKHRLVPVEE